MEHFQTTLPFLEQPNPSAFSSDSTKSTDEGLSGKSKQQKKSKKKVQSKPVETPPPHPGSNASKKKDITLHEFQVRAKREIYQHIKNGERRILTIAPMGFGKTYLSGWIMNDAIERNKRCMFLVETETLIDQTCEDFQHLGLEPTIFQGDRMRYFRKEASLVVASAQTIESKLKASTLEELLGHFDLIIGDEAHDLCFRSSWAKIEDHYLPKDTILLMLTGTPDRRATKEYMGQWADVKVVGAQPPELIKAGKITYSRCFGIGDYFDFTQLEVDRGDYTDVSIERQAISRVSTQKVVAKYHEFKHFVPNQIALAFCATLDHARAVADAFNEAGIAAEWISGSFSRDERKAVLDRLKSKQTKVLACVGTIKKGVNIPIVDMIFYLRPTKSRALFMQSVCRGNRIYPGKSFYLILDFGDNIKGRKFGNPSDYQDYDITERSSRHTDFDPLKECPECGEFVGRFLSVCQCGYEFSTVDNDDDEEDDEQADVELVELFSVHGKNQLKYLRGIKKQYFKENREPTDAIKGFMGHYGFLPPSEWHYQAILGKNPSNKALQAFENYLEYWKNQGKHQDLWVAFHRELELGSPEQQEKDKQRQESKKRQAEERRKQREEWKKKFENWANWYANATGTHTGANQQQAYSNPPQNPQPHWREVLGVSLMADWGDIKKAYIQLALKYHPDTSDLPKKEATSKMQELNKAYEVAKVIFKR